MLKFFSKLFKRQEPPVLKPDLVKVEFLMPRECYNRLGEMAERAGVSKAELLNASLSLLKWSLQQKAAGREIASIDPKNPFDPTEIDLDIFNRG